ncbi:DUF1636 family protein [Phaeobacter sp. HF9A]|uniref:DUF1636 family protein n=1 Tax=Phaeobacter sp. HF9A TaxID=2721561 RepID=UPI00142FCCF6|nr:DUF1636 family protein [Phaeobacter sp. HF9A]NIZ14755.1 DUF1636 domain-containing protein [Phaeobacter sp. HF9A]
MSHPTISLCQSCDITDPTLPDRLAEALRLAGLEARLQSVGCMSGCIRPQVLAVRQSGKTAYLFGEITAADIPDLVTFLRLYGESRKGTFPDARPLGGLRNKAIARIPPERGGGQE